MDKQTAEKAHASLVTSDWHVWEVEGEYIAATSLESAISHHMGEWGMEREDMSWDDTHCDRSDYYTNPEEDEHPSSIMREVAEGLMEGGKIMPFDFARTI